MKIEISVPGSLFGIMRLCRVMTKSDPEGRIFLSVPNNNDRLFFLHTLWSRAFDFNVGVAINESHSYTMTSAILKVDVVCDVTPHVLATELRDLLYNQCIDNTYFSFFIYPKGRISICKISFVSTGKKRRKPSPVCKKSFFIHFKPVYYSCKSVVHLPDLWESAVFL